MFSSSLDKSKLAVCSLCICVFVQSVCVCVCLCVFKGCVSVCLRVSPRERWHHITW